MQDYMEELLEVDLSYEDDDEYIVDSDEMQIGCLASMMWCVLRLITENIPLHWRVAVGYI